MSKIKIFTLLSALLVGAHALSGRDQINLKPLLDQTTSEVESDRVESLPGVDKLDFDLYSG